MVVVVSEAAWTKVWDPSSGVAYRVIQEGSFGRYHVNRLEDGIWYAVGPAHESYNLALAYATRRVQRTLAARRYRFRKAAVKAHHLETKVR